MKCEWCEEDISEADVANGATAMEVVETLDDAGVLATSRPGFIHRECLLRQVFGAVGHQKGTCHCFGGKDDGDPPGMTRRQAAIEAAALAYATMNADTGGVH